MHLNKWIIFQNNPFISSQEEHQFTIPSMYVIVDSCENQCNNLHKNFCFGIEKQHL